MTERRVSYRPAVITAIRRGRLTGPASRAKAVGRSSTADGQRLTPDEAFRRASASGPGGRKGMADASVAAAVALAFYYNEVGIDPYDPITTTTRNWHAGSQSMPPSAASLGLTFWTRQATRCAT